MADIELVIKIPENVYRQIQALARNGYFEHDICGNSMRRIANGTPLPKGHGRLIDANALEKRMCDRETEIGDDKALWESSVVSVALDMFAPTIIKADKGENEDKV